MRYFQKEIYKRQFFSSPIVLTNFPNWQHVEFECQKFHIYAHPELELTQASDQVKDISIVLLGYAIDPNFPKSNNRDITQNLLKSTKNEHDFATSVIKLAGRYVFLLKIKDKFFVFNDAGGLRSIYYLYKKEKIYLGTQPSIMEDIINLQPSENYETFINSRHYKEEIQYWLPAGATLYKGLKHLIPNHYLDIAKKKQIRFWPNKKIENQNLNHASNMAANLLKNLMYAASLRNKLAIALTGGMDSRILLAASRSIAHDIFIFTIKTIRLKKISYDISIPSSILKKFKLNHHIIECSDLVDPEFYSVYKKSVHLAHLDYAIINNALFDNFPKDRISIEGNGSEIARCALYPDGKFRDVISINQILEHYWTEWKEIPFVLKSFEEWFNSAKKTCSEVNMDIQDLFVMEQRTASWNAQANNEADIVSDSFTPFLHRPLLELMLGVPPNYRQYENSVMHGKITENLWPELLNWPINARWKKRDRFKHFMAIRLRKIGLYDFTRKVYKMVHAKYMKLKEPFWNKNNEV